MEPSAFHWHKLLDTEIRAAIGAGGAISADSLAVGL